MTLYLHQWAYKEDQVTAMLKAAPSEMDRAELIRTSAEAFGGKLHAFYYCFGQYDGVAISEFNDETTALACLMAICGQGRIKTVRTAVLFRPEQGVEAVRIAREVLGLDQAAPPVDR
jgi:uncharacterized protein with GYD domain